MEPKRPWGGGKTTIIVLVGLALLSAGASLAAQRSGLPGGLRLGTGWFFHAAFGVLVFVVLYALAALLTATVRAGGPPTKLSGLGFSMDWEKALEIANSGAESLEELNNRVSGVQDELSTLIEIGRETQEAIVALADSNPSAPADIKAGALARTQLLDQLDRRADGRGERAAEVIAKFRANLTDIERLHEEMTRA
jgi:hypothetical protein